MKISELLSGSSKPFPSIETIPPLKGVTKKELTDSIRPFMEFNPPYINVTRHRDEFEYREESDGTFSRHVIRRRISETAVCAAIQSEFKVEVVPHIICAGSDSDAIENQFQDLRFLGINNMMALRGDCLSGEKRFTPEKGGYKYAGELVDAARTFEKRNGWNFCIGVGAYPEKHFEAPNLDMDIANLKKKVDAGADFIITQMFFDNQKFYDFRDKCIAAGITVPIIPGLKPISTPRQIELLPESFSIDIPTELASEIIKNPLGSYNIGREWCECQCHDLLKHGVPAVHFYTMGRPDNIITILERCF